MVCRFARDPVSKEVSSVVCLLCSTNCGRDSDDTLDHKQKRTSNNKYYTAPWRTDNFVSHHRNQHATMWWDEDYEKLTNEEKKFFFNMSKAPEAVNLRLYVQPEASVKAQVVAKQKCSFVIDGDIISKIIVDLLLITPTRIRGGDEADLEENSTTGDSPPAYILLSDGEKEINSSNDLNNIQGIASLEKKKS
jgi:hypothetical protein